MYVYIYTYDYTNNCIHDEMCILGQQKNTKSISRILGHEGSEGSNMKILRDQVVPQLRTRKSSCSNHMCQDSGHDPD